MGALHLTAALRYADASRPEPVVFISWDRDQRAAAVTARLELLPKAL
jgi:hypothetical protein